VKFDCWDEVERDWSFLMRREVVDFGKNFKQESLIEGEFVLRVLMSCLIEFLDFDSEFIQASECSDLDFLEKLMEKCVSFKQHSINDSCQEVYVE
jgi:hypothetical protein